MLKTLHRKLKKLKDTVTVRKPSASELIRNNGDFIFNNISQWQKVEKKEMSKLW
jgi:hypothetical protein